MRLGVVVKRVGIGDERVHVFCGDEGVPLLTVIPEDRPIAEACLRGRLTIDVLPEHRVVFEGRFEASIARVDAANLPFW